MFTCARHTPAPWSSALCLLAALLQTVSARAEPALDTRDCPAGLTAELARLLRIEDRAGTFETLDPSAAVTIVCAGRDVSLSLRVREFEAQRNLRDRKRTPSARALSLTVAELVDDVRADLEAAAERARLEAEQQAERDAAERARREAEQQAARDAAERARLEAEQQAARDAAERARLEAEQQAARDAAERARLQAEQQAARARRGLWIGAGLDAALDSQPRVKLAGTASVDLLVTPDWSIGLAGALGLPSTVSVAGVKALVSRDQLALTGGVTLWQTRLWRLRVLLAAGVGAHHGQADGSATFQSVGSETRVRPMGGLFAGLEYWPFRAVGLELRPGMWLPVGAPTFGFQDGAERKELAAPWPLAPSLQLKLLLGLLR